MRWYCRFHFVQFITLNFAFSPNTHPSSVSFSYPFLEVSILTSFGCRLQIKLSCLIQSQITYRLRKFLLLRACFWSNRIHSFIHSYMLCNISIWYFVSRQIYREKQNQTNIIYSNRKWSTAQRMSDISATATNRKWRVFICHKNHWLVR